MCKGCQLANNYVKQRYDDPHKADFVETPRHKWKFYLGEADKRYRSFIQSHREAQEELQALARKLEALNLNGRPTIDEQRKVFEAFEQLQYQTSHYMAGSYYCAIEDIGDGLNSLDYFAQTIEGLWPSDKRRDGLVSQRKTRRSKRSIARSAKASEKPNSPLRQGYPTTNTLLPSSSS